MTARRERTEPVGAAIAGERAGPATDNPWSHTEAGRRVVRAQIAVASDRLPKRESA